MCLREGENRQPQTGSGGGQGTHRGRKKDRREGDRQGEAWEAEGSLSLLSSHTRIQWGSPSPSPSSSALPLPPGSSYHQAADTPLLQRPPDPVPPTSLPVLSFCLLPHRFHFLTHSSICRSAQSQTPAPTRAAGPHSFMPPCPSLTTPLHTHPSPRVISNPHSQPQPQHSLPLRNLFPLPCVYQQPRQLPSLSCGRKMSPPAASHLSPGLSPIPSVLPKNNHSARHVASHTLAQWPHRSWKHDDP